MQMHIKRTVSRCFASLHQLRQIRHLVPTATLQMLVVSLVHSRLDYGNSVLVGLPAYLLRQLQSVLNAAARLVYHLRARDHITDALISLHWLLAPEWILYKMAVLTHMALHGGSPRYLSLLVHAADVSGQPTLCSAGSNRLWIPPRSNCQPSAVERFRSQQHSSGTVCQTTSRQPIRCQLSGSN